MVELRYRIPSHKSHLLLSHCPSNIYVGTVVLLHGKTKKREKDDLDLKQAIDRPRVLGLLGTVPWAAARPWCRVTCHIVSDLPCWNSRSTVKYTLIDKVETIVHGDYF